MKKLFQIRSTKTGEVFAQMFHLKPLAKRWRDELGGPPEFAVTPGPDHRNYERGKKRDRAIGKT
jgi:hypothetical protein